ncbi:MAG: hypothetical protein PVI86_14325 [Phycisphaerae bacterium]|jgi:hypothetical protein
MSAAKITKTYGELVAESRPSKQPPPPSQEEELDALLRALSERREREASGGDGAGFDPVQRLREVMAGDLIPEFVALVEKYSRSGVSMEMDATDLLNGGRGIQLEFEVGEHGVRLQGTVTSDAIAFHETRHAPDVHGEIASGPMLRLRGLNKAVFREFICERLCVLLRAVIKRR